MLLFKEKETNSAAWDISMKFRSNESVDFFLAVLLGLLFSFSKTALFYFAVNENFVSREDPLILIKNVLKCRLCEIATCRPNFETCYVVLPFLLATFPRKRLRTRNKLFSSYILHMLVYMVQFVSYLRRVLFSLV